MGVDLKDKVNCELFRIGCHHPLGLSKVIICSCILVHTSLPAG